MIKPVKTALLFLYVIVCKKYLNLFPATFCIASLMIFIPKRNKTKAPVKFNKYPMTVKISIKTRNNEKKLANKINN